MRKGTLAVDLLIISVAMAVLLTGASRIVNHNPSTVYAQITGGIANVPDVATASLCKVYTGATITFCPVIGDGLYLAVGTGSFQKVVTGAQSTGVQTVNGKPPTSGNVNIGYADLITKPSSLACSTATHGNAGLTASGCLQN